MDTTPEDTGGISEYLVGGPAEPAGAPTIIQADGPADGTVGPGSVVGNYRITHRLGQGGMGEVFVARDEKLGRDVALKAIRADARLDPGLKLRFLREARVLSSLDHPGICRVFDYLETPAGDFIVLELIDGESLARAIRRGLDRATRLRVAEDLATTLAAAHAAGVVHRDLKPENVMLTSSGDVRVLDFGLASVQGSTEDEEPAGPGVPAINRADVTRSIFLVAATKAGQVMGTPLYMSPEQARGDVVTAASDLYSLGLLYQELFTGEPPYDDGLEPETLIERARDGAARPIEGAPRLIAQLITSLRSMTPDARPTAAQAAARLRWIRERPRRWLRRGVLAAAVGIAFAGAIKYTVDLRRERTQAVTARNDAEDLLTFMIGDLKEQLTPVGRLDVLDSVGDKALAYLSGLPERDVDDEALFRRAQTLHLIGEVRMSEGKLDEARQAFEESLVLATELVNRRPGHGEWLAGLGASHFYVGSIDLSQRNLDAAMDAFDEYHAIAERLVGIDPDDPAWQMELAYAHGNRGAVFEKRRDLPAAIEETSRSIAIKRELVAAHPEDRAYQRSLANSLSWLATARRRSRDLAGALSALDEELAIREALCASDPRDTDALYLVAICHNHRGHAFRDLGRPGDALASYTRERDVAKSLTLADPVNADWQRELAVSHRFVGETHLGLGELDAAVAEFESGQAILETLLEGQPDHVGWRIERAETARALVRASSQAERWSEAVVAAERARTELDDLVASGRAGRRVRLALARLALLEGSARDAMGQSDRAIAVREIAIEVIEPVAGNPGDVTVRRVWAEALLYLDRIEEARPILQELGESAGPDLAALARAKGAADEP